MITIYTSDNTPRISVSVTEAAKYRKELMKEEFIQLPFSSPELIPFSKGDYILTEYGRFELVELSYPVENETTGGYDYDLRFDDQTAHWKNRICFYDRQGNKEKAWSLTRQPQYFLDIITDNLTSAGLGTYNYSIGDDVENKPHALSFDSRSIFDALTDVAEQWETEWYVSGNMIHLGKCEFGTEVIFDNTMLASISRQDGENGRFATRIYPFGSTRNIPRGYRGSQENSVVEGLVEKRLMLPSDVGDHIDAWEDLDEKDIVEAVVVFDEVYPHRESTVHETATMINTDTVEEADGTITKVEWEAWQIKDNGLDFKEDYILKGETLRVVFQSGNLNGLDFGVIFRKEKSGNGAWFEIVRSNDYGISLPNENLHPEVADKFILYGMDMAMVEDSYIMAAEQELYNVAKKYLEQISRDQSVYQCEINPVHGAGYGETAPVEFDFEVGQKVKIDHPTFFGEEGRSSRIYSFEKRLDNKYLCTYQVGETTSYSRIGDLENKMEELTYKGKTFTSTGTGGVYLITRYDSTPASDLNAYSARRADAEFLRKNQTDTAKKLLTFLEGAKYGEFIPGPLGDGAYIDAHGNGEMTSLVLRSFLEAPEFRYNRIQVVGGELYATNGSIISEVEEDNGSYLLTLKIEEGDHIPFMVNDILLGSYLKPDGFFSSYMRIINIDDPAHQIRCVLGNDSEVPGGRNMPPVPFMNIVQYGNFTDETRQSSIRISSKDQCIVMLGGVNNYLTDKSHIHFGIGAYKNFPVKNLPVRDNDPIVYARAIAAQQSHKINYLGNVTQNEIDRGQWSLATALSDEPYVSIPTECHLVYHNSCKYKCITNETTQEPRWNASDWVQIMGDTRLTMKMESSEGLWFRPSGIDTTLSATVFRGYEDITADIYDMDWIWTRESGDVIADTAWNAAHTVNTHTLRLTLTDMGDNWVSNRSVKFICTAYVRDGETTTSINHEINYNL